MKVNNTNVNGVKLILPDVYADPRGSFQELWQRNRYLEAGLGLQFVQDNLSRSCKNTLRGLHYQIDHAQGKLVQAISGEIFDVAVDLRKESSTFGHWFGTILSEKEPRQIYLPEGIAHGFLVMSEEAVVLYKCTDFYLPAAERTLLWDDPEVGIDWPLDGEPILSEKDLKGVALSEAEVFCNE